MSNTSILPEEILLNIFTHLYPPWHLVIKSRENQLIFNCFPRPKYLTSVRLPISPLLTSKACHRIASRLLIDAFMGDINAYDEPTITGLPPNLVGLEPRVRRLCLPFKRPPFHLAQHFINHLPNIVIIEVFIDDPLTCEHIPFQPDPQMSIEDCRQRHIDWIHSPVTPYAEMMTPLSRDYYHNSVAEDLQELIAKKGLTLLTHRLASFRLHPDLIYDVTYKLKGSDLSWMIVDKKWRTGPFGAEFRI